VVSTQEGLASGLSGAVTRQLATSRRAASEPRGRKKRDRRGLRTRYGLQQRSGQPVHATLTHSGTQDETLWHTHMPRGSYTVRGTTSQIGPGGGGAMRRGDLNDHHREKRKENRQERGLNCATAGQAYPRRT
jgi:hypothetical protein